MTTGAMNSSYHGIAARLDRLPISGFHKKILWLLAGITFCDSVDMAVGGPIGMVLQSEGWMSLEQFALFNSDHHDWLSFWWPDGGRHLRRHWP